MHDLRVHETSVYYIRYYESHIIKMQHTLMCQIKIARNGKTAKRSVEMGVAFQHFSISALQFFFQFFKKKFEKKICSPFLL